MKMSYNKLWKLLIDKKMKKSDLRKNAKISSSTLVIHKAFGKGTVTKIDKAQKHIRVKFAIGEKTFIFPDAFKQGFLKMND